MEEVFLKGQLKDVRLFKINKFGDERGAFWESYKKTIFPINSELFQDNFATSQINVLRGLHFQTPPYAQGKFVQVIQGKVIDAIVDLRKSSPDYGKNFCIELSSENNLAMWVPEGFAHGYSTLENNTIFHYKCSNIYSQKNEGGLMWNDPHFNIDWKISNPILSEKDKMNESFRTFVSPF